jgi:ribonuclease Z
VIGLLRTLGLQAREEPMDLWTPAGTEQILVQAVGLGVERVPFDVRIHGVEPGEKVPRDGYDIVPFRVSHGGKAYGWAIVEHERLGRFDVARVRELGIPEGPLWGKLHHGQPVEVDGRTITADEVVGAPRPGRRLVISGDTRPCQATRDIAANADLLVHEATFAQDEAERAAHTGHSTAREAAELAASAGVLRLVLTHFSPRYADDPRWLEKEARAVFPETVCAHDGMVVEVPFRPE